MIPAPVFIYMHHWPQFFLSNSVSLVHAEMLILFNFYFDSEIQSWNLFLQSKKVQIYLLFFLEEEEVTFCHTYFFHISGFN